MCTFAHLGGVISWKWECYTGNFCYNSYLWLLIFFIHKYRDNCVQYTFILIVFTDHQVMLFSINKQQYIFLKCVLYQEISWIKGKLTIPKNYCKNWRNLDLNCLNILDVALYLIPRLFHASSTAWTLKVQASINIFEYQGINNHFDCSISCRVRIILSGSHTPPV